MAETRTFPSVIMIGPTNFSERWISEINRLLKQLSDHAPTLDEKRVKKIVNQPGFKYIIFQNFDPYEFMAMASLTIRHTSMGTTGFIDDVIVDKRYRCQGLGTLLLKYAISNARIMKAVYVDLTSNTEREAANALYQKLGFGLIGKVGESNYYRLQLKD